MATRPPSLPPQHEPEGVGLDLEVACPHCGAPSVLEDGAATAPCTHCRSGLLVTRDGAPVAVAACVVREEAQIRDAWLDRCAAEYRAELVTQARGGADLGAAIGRNVAGPAGAILGGLGGIMAARIASSRADVAHLGDLAVPFLEQRVAARRRELAGAVRIGQRRLLHVPYWHLHGLLAHSTFGRVRGGQKTVVVRGVAAGQTSPAYDGEAWNLRDRGLRIVVPRARLATPADARQLVVLPVRRMAAPRDDIDRRARGECAEDVEPLLRWSDLALQRRELLLLPTWVVEIVEAGTVQWLLVDARTQLVAGDLSDAAEIDAFLREPGESPFERVGGAPRVAVFASRCVECGRDVPHDPLAWMRPCPWCGTGLATGPSGLVRQPWDHVAEESGTEPWLPFWRFRVAVLPSGATEPLVALDDVARALGAAPPSIAWRGEHLWVPAWRLMGTPGGDRALARIAASIHAVQPEVVPGTPVPDRPRTFQSATLREDEARELARAVLSAACTGPLVTRMNVASARAVLQESRILLADPRLVYVSGEGVPADA